MSPINQQYKDQRMVEDGAMILSPHLWPRQNLQMKTQPWWEGPQEFGYIKRDNPRIVYNKDPAKMNDAFDSVSALVEKWSVD